MSRAALFLIALGLFALGIYGLSLRHALPPARLLSSHCAKWPKEQHVTCDWVDAGQAVKLEKVFCALQLSAVLSSLSRAPLSLGSLGEDIELASGKSMIVVP